VSNGTEPRDREVRLYRQDTPFWGHLVPYRDRSLVRHRTDRANPSRSRMSSLRSVSRRGLVVLEMQPATLPIITSDAERPTTSERRKKVWDVASRPIPHVIPPLEKFPMVYRISSNERTDPVNPMGHRIWGVLRGNWVPCERPNLICATRHDQEVARPQFTSLSLIYLPRGSGEAFNTYTFLSAVFSLPSLPWLRPLSRPCNN